MRVVDFMSKLGRGRDAPLYASSTFELNYQQSRFDLSDIARFLSKSVARRVWHGAGGRRFRTLDRWWLVGTTSKKWRSDVHARASSSHCTIQIRCFLSDSLPRGRRSKKRELQSKYHM